MTDHATSASWWAVHCGVCGDHTDGTAATLAGMLEHHANLHDEDDSVDFVVTVGSSDEGSCSCPVTRMHGADCRAGLGAVY